MLLDTTFIFNLYRARKEVLSYVFVRIKKAVGNWRDSKRISERDQRYEWLTSSKLCTTFIETMPHFPSREAEYKFTPKSLAVTPLPLIVSSRYLSSWKNCFPFHVTYLGNTPWDEESSVLRIGQHSLGSVEEAKVWSTVDDDSLDRHTKSSVQTHKTIRLEDLGETVTETVEFTAGTSLTDVSGQSGMQ